mmetsp:Transcript_30757/g.34314  ORF Transcript_30757/g.34314 Transcript_30757/m.34314 type:complete len:574 (+) Transcript_30757:70-1791(+)
MKSKKEFKQDNSIRRSSWSNSDKMAIRKDTMPKKLSSKELKTLDLDQAFVPSLNSRSMSLERVKVLGAKHLVALYKNTGRYLVWDSVGKKKHDIELNADLSQPHFVNCAYPWVCSVYWKDNCPRLHIFNVEQQSQASVMLFRKGGIKLVVSNSQHIIIVMDKAVLKVPFETYPRLKVKELTVFKKTFKRKVPKSLKFTKLSSVKGNTLLLASIYEVELWDLDTGVALLSGQVTPNQQDSFELTLPIMAVAYGGNTIACCTTDTLYLFYRDDKGVSKTKAIEGKVPISCLTYEYGIHSFVIGYADGGVSVLSVASKEICPIYEVSRSRPYKFGDTRYRITSTCLLYNRYLVTGSQNGAVSIWHAHTAHQKTFICAFQSAGGRIRSVSVPEPDSGIFVISGEDELFSIWKPSDKKLKRDRHNKKTVYDKISRRTLFYKKVRRSSAGRENVITNSRSYSCSNVSALGDNGKNPATKLYSQVMGLNGSLSSEYGASANLCAVARENTSMQSRSSLSINSAPLSMKGLVIDFSASRMSTREAESISRKTQPDIVPVGGRKRLRGRSLNSEGASINSIN